MPACRNFQQREIRAMLAAFSGRRAARNRAFFALGVTTGFRVSELCSLTLADVPPVISGGDQTGHSQPREAAAMSKMNLTPKEFAERVGLHQDTVYARIKDGTLPFKDMRGKDTKRPVWRILKKGRLDGGGGKQ